MAGFGMDTDLFGKADTVLKLVSSKKTPRPKQIAEARDSLGNIAAQAFYGTVTIYDAECVYTLKSGSKNLNTFKLGAVDTGGAKVITGIDGSTSNGEWPQLTFKGVIGAVGAGVTPKFTLPSITINGAKKAQAVGFTLGADCKLTGSGFSAAAELAETPDSEGAVAAQALSGATFEATGEAVEVAAAVTVTWDTGPALTQVQGPGSDKSNTAYGTTSFSGQKFLAKDT